MKNLFFFLSLIFLTSLPLAAEEGKYQPQLFKSLSLIYEDTFDSGKLNTEFWEIRQSSTWVIKEGILCGSEATKEFQQKKVAEGDRAHAGFKPVIWLKKVPENFACALRLRYDAKTYQRGFPLLDLGHHIHTLTFSEKATTLTIKKDVQKVALQKPLFSLNEWHDVIIELKKGALLLQIDGVKHLIEGSHMDMTGQSQIDFKGVDFGTCQVDSVKLWEGKP